MKCEPLTLCGCELQFVESVKYLGVQFVAAKKLACSVEHVRVKCYRTFNAILSRSKGAQSELVTLQLFKSYCLPFMLYASEVMPLSERLVSVTLSVSCGPLVFVIIELLLCARIVTFVLLLFSLQNYLFVWFNV